MGKKSAVKSQGSGDSKPKRESVSKQRALARAKAKKRKQLITWAVAGVALVGFLVLVFVTGNVGKEKAAPVGSIKVEPANPPHSPTAQKPGLWKGDLVPNFTGPSLIGGGTISWSNYEGKPVFLTVWAPWCPHCQKELPQLGQIHKAYPDVQIVTVVTGIGDQPAPAPETMIKQDGLTGGVPTVKDDAAHTLNNALGVAGYPTIYLVGPDGKVIDTWSGETPSGWLDTQFQMLRSLASTPTAASPSP